MKLVVIGAGGHGTVVVDAALTVAGVDVVGFLDDHGDQATIEGTGFRVLGPTGALDTALCDAFVVAIGDNETRKNVFDRACRSGVAPRSIIHNQAIIARHAEVGAGVFVAAGAILNPFARVGRNAIINSGAIVEHHVVTGDHAHVGPGVRMGGRVIIGEGALIGVGAVILPGVTVGPWAIVGAGAVVREHVTARAVVAGNPARTVRG